MSLIISIINEEIEKFLNEDWESHKKHMQKYTYSAPNIQQMFNKNNIFDLVGFVRNWSYYQSNYYDHSNDQNFIDSYNKLPIELKKWLTPSSFDLKNAYRGAYPDELTNPSKVFAFSQNGRNVSKMFGDYIFPFSALETFSALISSAKMVGFLNKRNNERIIKSIVDEDTYYELIEAIGNDEGEILVMNPKYKKSAIENPDQFYYV